MIGTSCVERRMSYGHSHVNDMLRCQHRKAPLAAALSPFLAFCTHPTHDVTDVWRLATPPGCMFPTLLEQCCGFFYVPQEPDKCKCCETGPTVFCPYLWRLESLTICRCHYKGSTLSSVFKDPECWSGWSLNPWPPAQQTGTLPTDLTKQLSDWLALFGDNGLINSFLGWKKCYSLNGVGLKFWNWKVQLPVKIQMKRCACLTTLWSWAVVLHRLCEWMFFIWSSFVCWHECWCIFRNKERCYGTVIILHTGDVVRINFPIIWFQQS